MARGPGSRRSLRQWRRKLAETDKGTRIKQTRATVPDQKGGVANRFRSGPPRAALPSPSDRMLISVPKRN